MSDKTPRMTAAEFQARQGSEHDHQKALFEWRRSMEHKYPELVTMYANVNGQYRAGQRPEPGLRPGVPDVVLPVSRGGSGALFIELKHGSNTTTKAQERWLERLEQHGNKCAVCYSWEEAKDTIEDYLNETEEA